MKKFLLTLIVSATCISAFALTSITTKKINGTPFCGGASVSVSYTVDAPANAGNVFTAQLSNKNGSFATPINIGTLASTGSGTIAATIPQGTPTGIKYRIRVVASNPAVIGTQCPNAIKINPAPTSVAVAGITSCQATLTWIGTPNASSYKVQVKKSTSTTWSAAIDVTGSSYTFTGLASGTSYDFQVRSSCSNGQKSDWVKVTAATSGCITPTGLIVTAIGISTSSLNWDDAACATDYSFRYRMFGTTTWTYKHPVPSNIDLTGLFAATLYEAQVATRCSATDSSGYTASVIWETNYFRTGAAEAVADLNVFPNPSTGDFSIQFNTADVSGNADIRVQNVYGQVVLHKVTTMQQGMNEQKITLDDQAPGLYLVTVSVGEKESHHSVVIK